MTNYEKMRQRPRNGMPHQGKYSYQWMMIAFCAKESSSAERKKVGAAVVTNSLGVYTGYNGTAPGDDNCCEVVEDGQLVTKPTVIHAEQNALDKMLMEGVSAAGSIVYITLSPCIHCAMRLAGSGVSAVYYLEGYRCNEGIEYLRKRGILVDTWESVLGKPFEPLRF